MTPDQLAGAARNLAHGLGIPVYIRDGRIYQNGPGVAFLPPERGESRAATRRPPPWAPLSRGRPRESFDDDLPVHPWMRCADVKVVARLIEGDLLRLARVQDSSVPASDFAAFERSRSVRRVAGIGEGQRRARFDLGTTREKDIFHIVGADLDLVDVIP